ncbi:MAG TPA: hypothetical protein VNM37_06680 [Candidatus Dormibacteraeota bacterium]|nr:hypothetical protein [Candidatus Dormibacteraeota bacterium]
MHHRPWTRASREKAQELANKGMSFEEMGKILGRTRAGMYAAWYTKKFDIPGMQRPPGPKSRHNANGRDPYPAAPETTQ